jgi:hypothetical protein
MKPRATYSKDYKKAQELKKIKETCRAEDVRCYLILKELVQQKMAYTTHMDEVSRLNDILIQFKKEVQIN